MKPIPTTRIAPASKIIEEGSGTSPLPPPWKSGVKPCGSIVIPGAGMLVEVIESGSESIEIGIVIVGVEGVVRFENVWFSSNRCSRKKTPTNSGW
jgi:hypothetical protein